MAERTEGRERPVRAPARRLFFALWPSPDVQRSIELAMRRHVEASGGRAVPVRNLHVTLAFLGEVPESRLDIVTSCAASVGDIDSFELQFDRIEIWARSHVLCLAMQSVPGSLQRLFEQLRFNLLSAQFEVRQEEYRPHVTLARDVRRREKKEPTAPIGWRVEEFVLVQSQRGAAGSQYSVVDGWQLYREKWE